MKYFDASQVRGNVNKRRFTSYGRRATAFLFYDQSTKEYSVKSFWQDGDFAEISDSVYSGTITKLKNEMVAEYEHKLKLAHKL